MKEMTVTGVIALTSLSICLALSAIICSRSVLSGKEAEAEGDEGAEERGGAVSLAALSPNRFMGRRGFDGVPAGDCTHGARRLTPAKRGALEVLDKGEGSGIRTSSSRSTFATY
jgi:hypothetical protein